MPKPINEDRARRRAQLQEKREARRAASKAREEAKESVDDSPSSTAKDGAKVAKGYSCLLELPEVAIQMIFSLLSAADLGRLTFTCKKINQMLPESRVPFLVSRLKQDSKARGRVGYTHLCTNEAEARGLLDRIHDGGDTGRILPRGNHAKKFHYDFVAYARFLEEAVSGYSALSTGSSREPIMLPRFTEGRFASVSPEHSLCRVGGDGKKSGAGGSGVASWGVGNRGYVLKLLGFVDRRRIAFVRPSRLSTHSSFFRQLGHGRRQDERKPRMLLEFGFGVRILQVSAGGGLVRVAHSLLLTSNGRVLSFGTGQYGALGHGYSAGKQLPDMLRPQYIESLNGVCCVCVAAGELHSAIVTSDGDVYTWGDGFCGEYASIGRGTVLLEFMLLVLFAGQLGHGDKRPQLSPRKVTKGCLDDEIVASVSCGSRHTIAVTEDGEVFSWGLGHFGCLGRSFSPFHYDADASVVSFPETGEHAIPYQEDAVPEPPPERHPARHFAAELSAHLDLIANLSLDDSSDQCIPKQVESLLTVRVVGASCGHRHSLFLDDSGTIYSCGSGSSGCLGHGNTEALMYPLRIAAFDEESVRVTQMSAGVDISMAVTTNGRVYAWGKTDCGRIGLGLHRGEVLLPRRVTVSDCNGNHTKAIEVECGYVHSLIVGLNGTIFMCGGVGVDGEDDGQEQLDDHGSHAGKPRQVSGFNIWHQNPEPKEDVLQERWIKYGKYEIKGKKKMMSETYRHS